MGLRPNQGDEKRPLFSNYSPWKHRPFLCHLDRSAAQWRDLRFLFLGAHNLFSPPSAASCAGEPGCHL